jgi:hypothetical protein
MMGTSLAAVPPGSGYSAAELIEAISTTQGMAPDIVDVTPFGGPNVTIVSTPLGGLPTDGGTYLQITPGPGGATVFDPRYGANRFEVGGVELDIALPPEAATIEFDLRHSPEASSTYLDPMYVYLDLAVAAVFDGQTESAAGKLRHVVLDVSSHAGSTVTLRLEPSNLHDPIADPVTRIDNMSIGTAHGEEVTTYSISHEPVGSRFDPRPASGVTSRIVPDDAAVEFPLPFGFTYFGQTFFAASVSTNGMVTFGSATTNASNEPFPTSHDMALFPYWDDLHLVFALGGSVLESWTSGVAPNRHVTFQWSNARPFYGFAQQPFRFHVQTQLYETTGQIVFSYAVPAGSSGFSPFASYTCGIQGPAEQFQFASPTNTNSNGGMPAFDFVFGAAPVNAVPTADAGSDRTVEATGALTPVDLDGRGSADPDGDALGFVWTGSFGAAAGPTPTVLLGLGAHEITLLVDDGRGGTDTDTVTVVVVDTTPPELSVSGLPDQLWPPNHELVRIRPSVVVFDATDSAPVVSLSITSSEPGNARGDGDTAVDFVVHGPDDFELRAERSGSGPGRVYTLEWIATDSEGNSARVAAGVTVPKSRGRK